MNYSCYIFLFFLLGFASPHFSEAQNNPSATLHLIVFCATGDSRVGNAAQSSFNYFSNELAPTVTNTTGMGVKKYLYKENAFRLDSLNKILNRIVVKSNDVILFFFDGHGWNNGQSEYPMITLGYSGDINTRSKPLSEVYAKLKKKNSRLCLVFANACNKQAATYAAVISNSVSTHEVIPENNDVFYKRLFSESKGNLVICSSEKGQTSQSDANGAWFFMALRDKIATSQNTPSITWGGLMTEVKKQTEKIAEDNGYVQNPYLGDSTTCLAKEPQMILPAGKLKMFIIYQENEYFYEQGKEEMEFLAQYICFTTGFTLEKHYFERNKLTETKLLSEINNLVCSKNDVVWFAYIGHGANYDGRFPFFSLGETAVPLPIVHDKLKEKNAHLVITTFDVCNHGMGLDNVSALNSGRFPQPLNPNEWGCQLAAENFDIQMQKKIFKKLFLQSNGDIMMCSARQGQDSCFGTYFTDVIVKAFKNVDGETDWNCLVGFIVHETNRMVSKKKQADVQGNCNPDANGHCTQLPDAEVNIH